MKNNKLTNLFNEFGGQFNIEEPKEGHEARFLVKLKTVNYKKNSSSTLWKTGLAIAASLLLLLSVVVFNMNKTEPLELASVSDEMSEVQDFFTTTIETELAKIDKNRSPLTENVINDALKQLEKLEVDYKNLKNDLSVSSKDGRVIHAMISNFQNRIDILNTVLQKIETIKQSKNQSHEYYNTI